MSTTDYREDLVRRAFEARAEAKRLTALANELLDELGLDDYDTYGFGEYVVTVSPTRRFDPGLAAQVLSSEDLNSILKTTPDAALAKKNLPPRLYTMCQTESSTPTRRIARAEADSD